jgi:hypothetical protein
MWQFNHLGLEHYLLVYKTRLVKIASCTPTECMQVHIDGLARCYYSDYINNTTMQYKFILLKIK